MSIGVLYRILHADSGEPVEIGGFLDYSLDVIEAEIRSRPEQFVLYPDPADYEPHGLVIKRVILGYEPAVVVVPIDSDVRDHLELLRLRELARHAVEIWRGGPAVHDPEEFEAAMANLSNALPTRPRPPVIGPHDPF